MEFVRLGAAYSTAYIPDKLIEGYNSLIWAERNQEPGEFELKSFDVEGLGTLLPEDTLVSHLETQEVMQVETQSIEMVGEGVDARPEITIRGRSATIILEHRWVESSYGKRRRMRRKYSATAASSVLLVQAIDNGSGFDLTRGDDDPETENVINSYPWNDKDVIPNVAVTEIVGPEGDPRWWHLEQGMLLPQLMKILVDADLGIRCLRPVTPSPSTVVTVQSGLANRGTVVRTYDADVTQLRFEVYSGIDRSATVQFSMLQGHLDKPIYLNSNRDYKTVVEVMSGEIEVGDVYRPGESGLTGWRRKTTELDAGTPEFSPEPEKPEDLNANATNAEKLAHANAIDAWKIKMGKWRNRCDVIKEDFREENTKVALRVLKQHRKINMFAGDVSSLSPYKYKTHYDLGDKVMLFGDYGRSAAMIVNEYVRTEDADGDRGFPGLVVP